MGKSSLMGAVAFAAVVTAAPAAAQNPLRGIPVTGQSEAGAFTGTFDIERFEAIGGQVIAVGKLSGTAGPNSYSDLAVALPVQTAHGNGSPPGAGRRGALETRSLTVPAVFTPAARQGGQAASAGNPMIRQVQATCNVLDLNLAPLDLDLLGLVVHLDAVSLHIEAQQGSGNLLGNLLCAVTNLLNGFNPNLAGPLSTTLNQLLAALGP